MALEIHEANWNDARDQQALLLVLDTYASGRSGGNAPLSDDVKRRLIPALREHGQALALLAFVGGQPAGIATCFLGFSTFYARPLLNVHDLAVMPDFQRRGIGRALLEAAEAAARARGCCKLTLEVREDNAPARELYRRHGFRDLDLAGATYPTLFLAKPLRATAET
jgi:ribosomal protein S18 acetylase RimI-like enzyme